MTDKVAPRTKAGLLAALIPLAFTIALIAYIAHRTNATLWMLVLLALAGAAVPFTVMVFAASHTSSHRSRNTS
jgi:hypothetical protein